MSKNKLGSCVALMPAGKQPHMTSGGECSQQCSLEIWLTYRLKMKQANSLKGFMGDQAWCHSLVASPCINMMWVHSILKTFLFSNLNRIIDVLTDSITV